MLILLSFTSRYDLAAYKRSIFVINPGFQYKFSLILCSVVFIGSLIYPLTIYDLFEKIISLQPGKIEELESNRNQLIYILGLIQLSYLGIIFVSAIFLSHKTAGPMFKLQNFLSDLRNNKEFQPISFRSGDNFQEIADEVNLTIEFFINQRKLDFEYLEQVHQYISNLSLVVPEDKKPVLQEILSRLATIQNRK